MYVLRKGDLFVLNGQGCNGEESLHGSVVHGSVGMFVVYCYRVVEGCGFFEPRWTCGVYGACM